VTRGYGQGALLLATRGYAVGAAAPPPASTGGDDWAGTAYAPPAARPVDVRARTTGFIRLRACSDYGFTAPVPARPKRKKAPAVAPPLDVTAAFDVAPLRLRAAATCAFDDNLPDLIRREDEALLLYGTIRRRRN
jgi:hypothetical protein